ncbi:MAG: sulfite exporter TauE/SafE family protein [Bacteroidota bacterium]
MDTSTLLAVSALIFTVAALYSSVGHGGASGYLAALSLFAVAPAMMSTTALVLNVLVAGLSLYAYARAGHLSMNLAWPFILLSIPAALLGGAIHVSDRTYFLLLAGALLFAAVRLAIRQSHSGTGPGTSRPVLVVSLPVGAGIGLLSGVVGVGGGIFLSPIMILMKWADTKQTAAVSALFIVVNSIAGLGGRFLRGGLEFGPMLPFLLAAFLGGLAGSYAGANKFSGLTLRRLLAFVLLIAAGKLLLTYS